MHTQSLMVCHSEYINWAINTYYLVMVKLFVACLIFWGADGAVVFYSRKNCPRTSYRLLKQNQSCAVGRHDQLICMPSWILHPTCLHNLWFVTLVTVRHKQFRWEARWDFWHEVALYSEKRPKALFYTHDLILTPAVQALMCFPISRPAVVTAHSFMMCLTLILLTLKLTNHQQEVTLWAFFKILRQMRSLVLSVTAAMTWEGPLIKCCT